MAIWDKLLGPVTDTFNKVLDKVAGDKIPEEKKAMLSYETQKLLKETLKERESDFQDFIIQYEGTAESMPKFIQVLRGSVRPVLTYGLAGAYLCCYMYLFFNTGLPIEKLNLMREFLSMLQNLNYISLSFWFGGRILEKTNILSAINKKDK